MHTDATGSSSPGTGQCTVLGSLRLEEEEHRGAESRGCLKDAQHRDRRGYDIVVTSGREADPQVTMIAGPFCKSP
ncbi:hypothetical protein Y1Q_0021146 [Alligator mississippiensis]|uniref:Uncharacterized protein n=1 Tax=Alligator mississippiensis TaxID=8496 RepID=A0A151NCR8_ALLMI|nr:hypothetical protein Y1Q_0021146 [Alligator mississippiensis]